MTSTLVTRAWAKAGRLGRVLWEVVPARVWRLFLNLQRLALPADPRPSTLVVVRVDAIGDYLLFRGCLRVLKESAVYRQYRLTVVGNRQWRSVAEALDGEVVDEWIWVDPTRYSRSPWYRAEVAAALPTEPFDTLVHPTFSRTKWADLLADDIPARHKIAGVGDRVNQRWSRDRSRDIYTQLLPVDHSVVLFEADRNREFFEHLLGVSLPRALPFIDPASLPDDPRRPPDGYVVFHLDASRPEKEWPMARYQALADHLVETTRYGVVLLGQGSARAPWASTGGRVVDLRDQTTLVEAASLLSRAVGFVGNDSALLHLALAVGVPAVVAICFGQHFGRFVPYPGVGPDRAVFVFPPVIEAQGADPAFLRQKYADGRFENIREISVDRVIQALHLCLK